MSISNRNTPDNEHNVIWIGVLAIVLVVMAYYYANTYLKYPAYYLLKYTYYIISNNSFLGSYLSESYTQDLVREWNQARFVIPNKKAIDHINVSLPFYIPLIFVYFLYSIRGYMRYTIPYTYRYKITSFDKLVQFKAEEFPQVLAGYLYGKEMVKNPELQKFGTYSAEYGPIRYLISIGVISYMGRTLYFKEKPVEDGEIEVSDDPKELSGYAKQLDINVNMLYQSLQESLGKRISSTDDLTDAQVALSRAFLIFASGAKNKKKAQKNMKRLAKAFTVKNPDGAKEKKKLLINRKDELKGLNDLLKKVDDKLIFNSEYQMEFLLSCYAYAKLNGADVSAPDFLWLKALERQTYLLLHAYSGDPDVLKNNSYIEVIAPMNRWLDLYRIFSLDEAENKSNKNQTFELKEDWAKLLCHQLNAINTVKEFTKTADFLKEEVSKVDDKQTLKADFGSIKPVGKFLKKTKLDCIIDDRLKYRTSKEMLMSLLITMLDQTHSSRIEKDQCLNYIRSFSWLIPIDKGLFNQICFICILKANTENLVNKLCRKASGAQAQKESSTLAKNIVGYDLDMSGKEIEFINVDDSTTHTKFVPVSELYVIGSLFLEFQTSSTYSTAEYKSLSQASFNSIDQAVITILYYMTNFEIWLSPKHKVELHEFLGGKIGE